MAVFSAAVAWPTSALARWWPGKEGSCRRGLCPWCGATATRAPRRKGKSPPLAPLLGLTILRFSPHIAVTALALTFGRRRPAVGFGAWSAFPFSSCPS